MPAPPPATTAESVARDTASDAERDRELAEECSEPECRYCKEGSSAGPLIAPCNCKGSMQYVHPEPCLRVWLETRHVHETSPVCEICHERYAIEYRETLNCTRASACSVRSWNSYCELVGVGIMCMCLITTLSVLWKHRNDKLELDNLTNYAVMLALGCVLFCASLLTMRKIFSRWWRDNSVTSLRPMTRLTSGGAFTIGAEANC